MADLRHLAVALEDDSLDPASRILAAALRGRVDGAGFVMDLATAAIPPTTNTAEIARADLRKLRLDLRG